MTEPILDGILINISACEHFKGIGDCKITNGLCIDNNNCYFKQLKRLEKENEELKKLKCKFKEYCTCDIEKYRSALEEIREEIGDLHSNTNRLINLQKILDRCNEVLMFKEDETQYYPMCEEWAEKCKKLEDSLKVWQYSDEKHLFKIIEYENALREIKRLQISGLDADKTTTEQSFDNLYKVIEIIDKVLNEK